MARKSKPKRRRKKQRRRTQRASARPRKVAASRKKPQRSRKGLRPRPRPLIEIAVREVNRGRSLTATARSLKLSPRDLQRHLRQRGLLRRKGKRWVFSDNQLRRVLVITAGRIRRVIVSGYENANLAGQHFNAAGVFVRSNNVNVLKPFRGRSVTASNGSRYLLETDPNALHRIAAMDTPPFHEIYEITSSS
jgi:hypothetical protein